VPRALFALQVYDKKVEAKLKELQQNQAKLVCLNACHADITSVKCVRKCLTGKLAQKAGGQVDIGLYDGPSDGLGDGGDMLAVRRLSSALARSVVY
jgi:hypothetical protein